MCLSPQSQGGTPGRGVGLSGGRDYGLKLTTLSPARLAWGQPLESQQLKATAQTLAGADQRGGRAPQLGVGGFCRPGDAWVPPAWGKGPALGPAGSRQLLDLGRICCWNG